MSRRNPADPGRPPPFAWMKLEKRRISGMPRQSNGREHTGVPRPDTL
jgi:hypothetical protein